MNWCAMNPKIKFFRPYSNTLEHFIFKFLSLVGFRIGWEIETLFLWYFFLSQSYFILICSKSDPFLAQLPENREYISPFDVCLYTYIYLFLCFASKSKKNVKNNVILIYSTNHENLWLFKNKRTLLCIENLIQFCILTKHILHQPSEYPHKYLLALLHSVIFIVFLNLKNFAHTKNKI